MQTILGIGAHYDDCVFGIPGILLSAVRKNHRVVILSLIGDYDNWKPTAGRGKELVNGTKELCREYGVEHRFLDFSSMQFTVTEATKRAVSAAVAEIRPDVAFMLWPHDQHADHEVASQLSKIALRHGDRLLPAGAPYRPARQIYLYDNGPRHTIGFEPDTYVDTTDDWPRAIEWLGRLMSLVSRRPYDPNDLGGAQRTKQTQAMYRGMTAGVKYAEAVKSAVPAPREVF